MISGVGNPVALQANLTVEPFRTVRFLPGCKLEITGGTEIRVRPSVMMQRISKHIMQNIILKVLQTTNCKAVNRAKAAAGKSSQVQ